MKTTIGTAVVTGASSGLGKVFADKLAGQGYHLLLIARREEELKLLAQQLKEQHNIEATYIVADLTNPKDLDNVSHVLATNTDITMLVNNAGSSVLSTFTEASLEKQMNMIELNLLAPVRLAHAVLQGFKSRNKGILINIGSAVGFNSLVFTSVYSGTKAFLDKFTQGLQEEYKDTNVKIVLAAPAAVATEIYEKGGIPLSAFDPSLVMTIENCVNAILKGTANNELTILPSVEEATLFSEYEAARMKLFAATQTGTPASRYQH